MVSNRIFHNDSLQLFNEKMFADILSVDNVTSKKMCITINGEKYYGYFLEKAPHLYFIEDFSDHNKSVIDLLPIKISHKTETDYNKKVFFFINRYYSVKIPDTKQLSFRSVVDSVAGFNHTNHDHWLLYKIICLAAWCDRVNYRIIAERGFGKDSVINNVKDLVGDTANIYGATFAKLEYSLTNKFLIFNEMGNLKTEDKFNMQQFLLAIGAFFNKYTKRSRASDGTMEEYDISKQSLSIIYNPPIYYVEKGQEFFDTMFTEAVLSRFIPFYLEGRLDEKFDAQFDVERVVDENSQLYKDIISTLRYYRRNPVSRDYILPAQIHFDDSTRRFERSFLKIANYIAEYAEDDIELFNHLSLTLYESYTNYANILRDAKSKIE